MTGTSVVDPDTLNPDLGPALKVNEDTETDPVPNPDPGFWWPKIERKKTAENLLKIFFDKKLLFIVLIPWPS